MLHLLHLLHLLYLLYLHAMLHLWACCPACCLPAWFRMHFSWQWSC
jgi:hypothetical protein